jgi:hypothetical protein
MLYFLLISDHPTAPANPLTPHTADRAIAFAPDHDKHETSIDAEVRIRLAHGLTQNWCRVINRNDLPAFRDAQTLAVLLGNEFLATDAGAHVSPRYDVQRTPKLGEPVSYSFNGDTYPCGHITKISAFPHRRIEATDETGKVCVFWRLKETGCWKYNRTWSLVGGHREERNPHI